MMWDKLSVSFIGGFLLALAFGEQLLMGISSFLNTAGWKTEWLLMLLLFGGPMITVYLALTILSFFLSLFRRLPVNIHITW